MNWKDSIFEIYMKTVVQPFTQIETHRLLHELREDRMFSIASALAESKRSQAKCVGAQRTLDTGSTQEFRLRADSFLLETKARSLIAQPCLDMARIELAFVDYLLTLVPTYTVVDWQAVQAIENAYELVWANLTSMPSGDVLRTTYSHPLSGVIRQAIQYLSESDELSKEMVTACLKEKLADSIYGTLELELSTELPDYSRVASKFLVSCKGRMDLFEVSSGNARLMLEKLKSVAAPQEAIPNES